MLPNCVLFINFLKYAILNYQETAYQIFFPLYGNDTQLHFNKLLPFFLPKLGFATNKKLYSMATESKLMVKTETDIENIFINAIRKKCKSLIIQRFV